MKCPNCGKKNREGARFCLACGMRLAAPDEAPSSPDTGGAEVSPTLTTEPPPPSDSEVSTTEETAAPSIVPGEETPGEETPSAISMPESESPVAGAEPLEEAPQAFAASTIEERLEEAKPPEPVQAPVPPAAEVLPPLMPETVVADRFEILELLESDAGTNLYSAHDLAICPRCREERDLSDNEYCSECGVALELAGPLVLCTLQEALSPEALGANAEDGVFHNGRFYSPLPLEEMLALPPVEPAFPYGMILSAGYASDVGQRDLDEDSLCVFTLSGVYESVADPTLGLFIVADGMGGHEGGEVASKLAVQIIAERLIQNVLLRRFVEEDQPLGEAVRAHLTEAINDANEQVYRLAQERANDMGCTLTMALVMDGKAYIANVGDSRTYIYGQEGLRQITTDHSVVASLIAARMAEPEELYTHPERHVIYRALGTKSTVEVDIWEEGLVPGDTLLLCCDGLWESIRDEGIQDVLLTQFDPQAACDEMVRLANQAGGEDNISVILVKVGAMEESGGLVT
jgi:serine/threonine protein phosphatase PrpC